MPGALSITGWFRNVGAVPALALALAGCQAPLPDAPGAAPAASLDPAALTRLEDRFQSALDTGRATALEGGAAYPGGIAAFILPDGHVATRATGYSDLEAQIPMQPDRVQPAGSIGKMFVASLTLLLAGDGTLGLDDPISTWLGEESWFARLPNAPGITVRMLLQHASGLPDHAFESEEFARDLQALAAAGDPEVFLTPRQLVGYVLDADPRFAPGQGFHYTDTGYVLLGLVLEEATGSSYYTLLRDRILDPLGLDRTFPQDRRDPPNLAQGYALESHRLFGVPEKIVDPNGALRFHPLTEWTGGGLFSNPRDLVRFARALFGGRLLDEHTLEEMVTPHPSSPVATGGYGLGVDMHVDATRGRSLGHLGFFPGYRSEVAYFEGYGVAVALQVNADTAPIEELLEPLAAAILDELEAARSPGPNRDEEVR